MDDYNGLETTTKVGESLGTYDNGPQAKKPCTYLYSSIIWMMLYMASNTSPDISFAVHHYARSNQNIKASHYTHRWALTVLRYPRNIVIYHDPPVGVIFMVIVHVFIINNYPNFYSHYQPEYTFWVIYPFL